ncbi:hypothetical protein [Actinomadura sp. 3N508]|uniref:hypothetical protein n=1 Tax=Actinomadura sp. 3N508 TaxID=3375153 RepID=UPI0037BBA947
MTGKQLAAIIVAFCLCVFGATLGVLRFSSGDPSSGDTAPPKSTPPSKAPVYAYATSQELVVMRGRQVVGRTSRAFDPANYAVNQISWTHDGKYVVFLSDAGLLPGSAGLYDESKQELRFINTQTGTEKRLPCPDCKWFATLEDDTVLATAVHTTNEGYDEQKVWLFDLDSGSPGVSQPLNTEQYNGLPGSTWLANTRNHMMVNLLGDSPRMAFFSSDGLEVLNNTLYSTSNSYMLATGAEHTIYGSEVFALAAPIRPGECTQAFAVDVHTPSRQESIGSDSSAIEPPGYKDGKSGLDILDMWWGFDGKLHATIASWTCDETKESEETKQVLVSPPTVWRLDWDKWVKEGNQPATMVRPLDARTSMVLVVPDCIGITPPDGPYCYVGKLYREEAGKRTLVADQVFSVSTPPIKGGPSKAIRPWPTPTYDHKGE